MYRKTYAVINGNILEQNAREIKNKYPNYQFYIGVVKNNAYHHGMKVVNDFIRGGINYLAVSSLEEALDVRKFNIDIPILVLEPIDLEFIDDIVLNKITITVDSLEYLKKLNEIKIPYTLNIHIKIDSGMNRLGFKNKKDINAAIKLINENSKLYLEGIYSHFATTGVQDPYYDKQLEIFKELTSSIDLSSIPIVHLDRSLTFVRHEKLDFVNGIRLGIALYGFSGSIPYSHGIKAKLRDFKRNLYLKKHNISPSVLENDLDLHTAFSLYSSVFAIRKVMKGEVVGYNASYKVKDDSFIATIPIGYADGVTKNFQYVVINKKRYSIVADSMDMLMVLVDKSVKIHDTVEIFGDNISIKEVTNRLNVNAYHLFNQISNRVPRIHESEDDRVEIKY